MTTVACYRFNDLISLRSAWRTPWPWVTPEESVSSMLVALVLVAPVALQCTPVGLLVALSWRRRLAYSCCSVAVAAAGG